MADLPSLYSFQSSTEPWTSLRLQRNTTSTARQTKINQRTIKRKFKKRKVQPCYLEELVAREEVGGGLQDSGHGFSQLLVHGSGGAGRVWLSPEYELIKTHSEP